MERAKREIQRRRIHEEIVGFLLDDINNGVYKVGEELPSERDLMDEFQVGRPAIRESLLKLERMGIIETRPGVRAKVCEPSVALLFEEMGNVARLNMRTLEGQKAFLDMRLFLENALCRIAAKRIGDVCLEKLRDILEEQSHCLDDLEGFSATDLAFHGLIAEVSGIPMVIALYKNMGMWLLEQRQTTLTAKGQFQHAYSAHVRILEALATRVPDAAEKAMTEHLKQVEEVYLLIKGSRVGMP